MRNITIVLFFLLTTAIFRPLAAEIIFYDSLPAFQASSSTSVVVTFDPFTPTDVNIPIPPNPPIILGGVTFTPLDGVQMPNLVVLSDAFQNLAVPFTTNILTTSGNENIDMAFSTAPTAVGFVTYTNAFGPPVVSVYDTGGNLLTQHTLNQAAGSLGFLGIVSDVPIGKVNWLAEFGNIQNSAIDNVRVGVAAETIPGDVNGDGVVNLLDVTPFVEAITSGTFIPAADINGDGFVNLLDVQPFVELLTG